jgi:hypothetical protein
LLIEKPKVETRLLASFSALFRSKNFNNGNCRYCHFLFRKRGQNQNRDPPTGKHKTVAIKKLKVFLFSMLLRSGKNSKACCKIPHSHSNGETVWEEMSGGDMNTAGEGSIVAGIGVDVDVTPPNTVRLEKHRPRSLQV